MDGSDISQKGSRLWPRLVLVAWLATGLSVAVHASLRPHTHTLFRIYAAGVESWRAGSGDLYALQPATGDFYRYSPAFAVASTPFAMLHPAAGNVAWKLTNAAAFALGLWVWCRHGRAERPSTNTLAGVFFVALLAVAGNLFNGQANLMMTGFVLLGLSAAARERWWPAAGFLAAATLIKAFPLALALVLAVLYWRKFPLRFAAVLAVGLLLPLAAQSPEYALRQTGDWLRHVTGSLELNRDRLRSLDKLFEIAGLGLERQAFQAVAAGAGAAVLAVGLWAVRRGLPRGEVMFLVGAWFTTWVLLYSPSSENATFSILGPFLAAAVVDAFRRPGTWASRAWLLASLYLMCLAGGDTGILTKSLFTKYPAATIGGIMFQLWLVADLLRRRASSAGAEAAAPSPPVTSRRAA